MKFKRPRLLLVLGVVALGLLAAFDAGEAAKKPPVCTLVVLPGSDAAIRAKVSHLLDDLNSATSNLCVSAGARKSLTKALQAARTHVDAGQAGCALLDIGKVIKVSATAASGHPSLLYPVDIALAALLLGDTSHFVYDGTPAPVTDSVGTLTPILSTYTGGKQVASAITSIQKGRRASARAQLARASTIILNGIVKGDSATATDRAAASYPLLSNFMLVMRDFDPQPTVAGFRAAVAAGKLDDAAKFLHSSIRANYRIALEARFTADQRTHIGDLMTDSLTLSAAAVNARDYRVIAHTPNLFQRSSTLLGFAPDCDGIWRLTHL